MPSTCLCRVTGVVTCPQVYVRLSFHRRADVFKIQRLVAGGDPLDLPKEVARTEPKVGSFLQQTYIDLIRLVIQDLGETMPHEFDVNPLDKEDKRARVYIPSGLASNVLDLTRLLNERGKLPFGTTPATLEYLSHKVFPRHFWYVHIKKWMPFARCDKCVSFFNELLAARTESERQAVRRERAFHIDCCTLFRRRHEMRMALGTEHPSLFCSVVADAMDNAKTQLPRVEGNLHNKKLDSRGQFLGCELLGVLVHGIMFYGAWILPHLKCNAAATITVLFRVMALVLSLKKLLPPVLLLQADNSGRDNKNQFMIAFMGWLVEKRFFKEARMYFLTVGHTHCIIDQRFSQVRRVLVCSQ